METYLPNEIWRRILKNVSTRDLITVRMVSTQLNHVSLDCLKERDIQITIRRDEDCEFMEDNFSNIFCQAVIINFVLHPIFSDILKDCVTKFSTDILRCTLNLQIVQPFYKDVIEENLIIILTTLNNIRNLKIIADKNIIRSKVNVPQMLQLDKLEIVQKQPIYTSPRINLEPFFTSFLETSPNIKTLMLKFQDFGVITFLIPPFHQLKHLSVQTNPYTSNSFNKATLTNWMINAPALEIFEHDLHFKMEANEYLNSIQHIKNAKPFLGLFRSHRTVPNIPGRLTNFELSSNAEVIDEDMSKDIEKFLSSQSETLKVLKIYYPHFRLETRIRIPLLKKLHTFIYTTMAYCNISSLEPERLPELKFVTFLNKTTDASPFTKIYPTVETFKLNDYTGKNWQRTFPNLTSFRIQCTSIKEYEYFLDNSQKVQSVDLCLNLPIRLRYLWNLLTGNSQIEPGNVFYIQAVNDKKSERPILPILPNLNVLKIREATLLHVKAIAFITIHFNFKTFRKLKFNIQENTYQTIPQDIIKILKNNHNVIFYSANNNELEN